MRRREWLGWGWLYSLINGLTADTSPDLAADHALVRDNSAGRMGKVLLQYIGAGKQTMWVPAGAMTPRVTNGPANATTESTTNDVMNKLLDFDKTTSEAAQFAVAFPKSWDRGTVSFIPVWTAAAGTATQTMIWSLAGVALADDDAIDTAFGTAVTSSDALIATGDIHVGPESAAVTIAGSPAANELVYFLIARDTSDTLDADARLIGIKLIYTTSVNTDN